MPTRPLLACALVAILVASLPLAAAQSQKMNETLGERPTRRSALPTDLTIALTAESPGRVHVDFRQIWQDEAAISMRKSLDAYFGAGTGDLSPGEVGQLERAVETDMQGRPLGWLTLDGQPYIVKSANVTFDQADGNVATPRPVGMFHDLHLEASESPDRAEVGFFPRWNGTLSFRSPAGWHVASASGLEGAAAPAVEVSGGFHQTKAVTLVLAPGEAPAPPADDGGGAASGTEGVQETSATVPAPGLALVLAAAAALALRRRSKDR